jgi:hypothetical protein
MLSLLVAVVAALIMAAVVELVDIEQELHQYLVQQQYQSK